MSEETDLIAQINTSHRSYICSICEGVAKTLDHRAVGSMMRNMREKNKIGLRQLAEKLRYSPAYLSDLELGRRNWTNAKIGEYLAALKKLV